MWYCVSGGGSLCGVSGGGGGSGGGVSGGSGGGVGCVSGVSCGGGDSVGGGDAPIMMTASCWASSIRHPPLPH